MYAFIEVHENAETANWLCLNDALEPPKYFFGETLSIGKSSDFNNYESSVSLYRFKLAVNLQAFKTLRLILFRNGFESLEDVDFRKMTLTIASKSENELDTAAELAAGIMSRWGFSLPEKLKEHKAILDAENAFFAARGCGNDKRKNRVKND